jgi:hypothetical protein
VLITFGSRGAWAACRDARVHVAAPGVDVGHTVGAGDAFTAGALAHLHHTGRLSREGVDGLGAGELARLLSSAVEIAADTCTPAGAQPPYRREGVPTPAWCPRPGRAGMSVDPLCRGPAPSHSAFSGASRRAQTGPRASSASWYTWYASSSTAARSGWGS